MTNFPTVNLGEVANFIRGITFKPSDVVPISSSADVVACMRTKNVQTKLDIEDVWGIPKRFVKRQEQFLKPGDMLVSTANSWNIIGKCSLVPELPWPATLGGFISGLRAKEGVVHPQYLYHWFSDERTQALVRSCARQTTNIANLSLEQCLALKIPLPSYEQQSRIAAILDMADEVRVKRRLALEKLEGLAQAVFVEMFGEPGRNPFNLKTEKLGSLCELVRGSSPRPQGDSRYFGGPVPRLMIADITRDGMYVTPRIDSLTLEGSKKSRPMAANSVVMAVSGAAGLPAILATDACIHDGFVGFRKLSEKISPIFLYHFLNSQRAINRNKGTGAIWVNLTTDQVKDFDVIIPSNDAQNNFNERIKLVDGYSEKFRDAFVKAESLFDSLQQRAFRGEL